MTKARDVRLEIPDRLQQFLKRTIREARGNEVFFLGRLAWSAVEGARVATLEEVDVLARGNRGGVPAVIARTEGWDIAIHNHPSGRLDPSDADLSIAAQLGDKHVAFAIISNDAARVHLVTAPFPPPGAERIDPEEIRRIFSLGGPLSGELEGFESRPGQLELALEVTRALNEDRIVAAEAGTRIGKSFAYLVPAILWAARNQMRVVVSTGTINLQEQLISKDLPFLAKVLPVPFRYSLIKGRGNYACKRKLEEIEADLKQREIAEDRAPDREQLRSLVEWAKITRDGSRSDLSWTPPQAVWEQVMSETDKSLKAKCPHYDTCFYYQARRTATASQVLVVNHHLFFADLAVRGESENYESLVVLPPYDRVIFDEAHHIEDAASEHFGSRFSRQGVLGRLTRLRAPKNPQQGVLPAIVMKLRGMNQRIAADSIEHGFAESVPEFVERIGVLLGEIEERFIEAARSSAPRGRGEAAGDDPTAERALQLRWRDQDEARPFWRLVSEKLAEVVRELGIVLKVNEHAIQSLEGAASSPQAEDVVDRLSLELTSFGSRLERLILEMGKFCEFEDTSQVRWISRTEPHRPREPAVLEFARAPVRVAGTLEAFLFGPMKSVVLTSATLSVAGKADFLADRLGLQDVGPDRFSFATHPSPFDFRRQVLTVVPTDFPLPDTGPFESRLADAIYRILEATRGRAFVLFTSYALLRRTYATLERQLISIGLRPTAQGDRSRSELLERFKAGVHDVLFGTDSFWEGVDVKGRALECVIITRLPFRVPSEPLQEARLEELVRRGENPFTAFTVPQAVLKLKQGFGRLIRSTEDRGVVALLDRRILTKPYGRVFLESLPETGLLKAPLSKVIEEVRAFFEVAGAAPGERNVLPARAAPVAPLADGRRPPPW